MVNLEAVLKEVKLNSYLLMPGLQAKINWFSLLAVTQDGERDPGRASEPPATSLLNTEILKGSNLKNKDELKRAWEFCCYVWIRSCRSRFPSKRPLGDTTYVQGIFKGHHVNKTHLGMQLLKGPVLKS